MSFDWREYIKLAEDLIKYQTEAALRSSISRAYYGVFCITRNKKGYKEYSGKDIHWKVINDYKNSGNINEKKIGRILDKLRKLRNGADYNEDKPINQDLAERSVISANDILNLLERK